MLRLIMPLHFGPTQVHPMTRTATLLLLLAVLVASVASCSDATADEPGGDGVEQQGRWHTAREQHIDERIEQLSTLSYVSGSKPAREARGITIFDESAAWSGLNLFTSGHASSAVLVDMEGNQLHEWRCSFDSAMPDYREEPLGQKEHFRQYFRRVKLLPDGDLLAIFEGHALVKLDRDSNLQWVFTGGPHHDLEVMESGEIYVLTRTPHMLDRINRDEPVLEDFISVLDPDGKALRRVSVLEAFERSRFASDLATMKNFGDLLHTNTLEVLDGRLAHLDPAFAKGNVLISCLKTSTIAVIDLEREEVVWSARGSWVRQHQPTVLDNGRLLLFDNLGRNKKAAHGLSRVLELDPVSLAIEWSYKGSEGQPFQSNTCGSCQRLPNGNTLITESDYGRAFEVNSDGRIVWEFISPYRVDGPDGALVATLFELIRIPREDVAGWLED